MQFAPNQITKSAHPARYSPDDNEAKYRVGIKQRFAPKFDAYGRFNFWLASKTNSMAH